LIRPIFAVRSCTGYLQGFRVNAAVFRFDSRGLAAAGRGWAGAMGTGNLVHALNGIALGRSFSDSRGLPLARICFRPWFTVLCSHSRRHSLALYVVWPAEKKKESRKAQRKGWLCGWPPGGFAGKCLMGAGFFFIAEYAFTSAWPAMRLGMCQFNSS